MKDLPIVFDLYTFRARFQPALLVTLPLGLAVLTWFPDGLTALSAIGSLVVWSGGAALLAQIGRDWGKRKEANLFSRWGGKPTTRLLQYRNSSNKILLERRHERLQKLTPDILVPSSKEEEFDPEKADETYETCVAYLRTKTRDRKKFPLIFQENCNYGFRRNLWGMKPIGIVVALLGAIAVAGFILQNQIESNSVPSIAVVTAAFILFLLTFWVFWITPDWVKTTAEAYAERLLEASEELDPKILELESQKQ